MCDNCVKIADAIQPAPDFVVQLDGCEITVADDGNRNLVLAALDLYADVYLDHCETLSALASTPDQAIVIMRNAINTTERVCALVLSLSANVDDDTVGMPAGTEN